MRRKDRELTEIEDLKDILNTCKVMRIGLMDGQTPYIVPLNYGYEYDGKVWKFYFHSAKKGRKIDLIAKNNRVFVEMDCDHQLTEGASACNYSYDFRSAMGEGTVDILTDEREKSEAMTVLMRHQSGKTFVFDKGQTESVLVGRISVDVLSGKGHLKQ